MTTLVLCSHGTRYEEGRIAVRALVDEVRELLGGVRIEQAVVDVEQPEIFEVVAEAAARGPVVVVPLLLSAGYHTRVDIARAVAAHPGVIQTDPLGPHDLLADVLTDRIRASAGDAGSRDGDAIVLAAAGSSDPAGQEDVAAMLARLRGRFAAPVTAGFAAAAEPRIARAVADARQSGAQRVIAASYVLAPGYFADVVRRGGADIVSAPLAPDPRIARIVVERFRAAQANTK